MKVADIPFNEQDRVGELHALNILDTPPEERFDRLTRLARHLFSVSTAVVSLVDIRRQWFKSHIGVVIPEISRDMSFCGHAILGDEILIVQEALEDERFHDNPMVINYPYIRFYAGCPIKGPSGNKLGTLCLYDTKPRSFDEQECALLEDLSCMVRQELIAVHLATMDELSKLSNRRGFEALAQHALRMCKRLDKPATLLYFDLDFFKEINDRFGHAEGDRALMSFSRILQSTFRESDVIGRLGGDEFVVLLVNSSKDDAPNALIHLERMVVEYNSDSQRGYDLCYSVGVLDFDPAGHDTIADLMNCADALMYQQKKLRREAP